MRIAFLACLVVLSARSPLHAMSEAQQLQGLEAVEAWEAAYPIALRQAERLDNFAAWREAAEKYLKYDTDGKAYLQAWKHAEKDRKEDEFSDLVRIRPDSEVASLAVYSVFLMIQANGDLQRYVHFVARFPDRPEALLALENIHRLAYEQVTTSGRPEDLDRFAATFPEADQAPEAEVKAYEREKNALRKELRRADRAQRAHVATRLLNEALSEELAGRAESQRHHLLTAQRKFRLLREMSEFDATQARTEQLLREENIRRFDALARDIQSQHEQTRAKLDEMREAILNTLVAQNSELKASLDQLRESHVSLRTALTTYQKDMDGRLKRMDRNTANFCNGLVGCAVKVGVAVVPTLIAPYLSQIGGFLAMKLPAIHDFMAHLKV